VSAIANHHQANIPHPQSSNHRFQVLPETEQHGRMHGAAKL